MTFAQRSGAAVLTAALLITGCSSPPPPAPEPTGDDLEQAWRIAVGENQLDATIAQVYAIALNSHEVPTVVTEAEESAVDLAVALARGQQLAEEDSEDRYEMVVARTMPLAEALDPSAYSDTITASEVEYTPAASPEELTELIESRMDAAELLEPTAGVLGQGFHITSITAEEFELGGEDEDAEDFAPHCGELRMGLNEELTDAADQLAEVYDCVPAEMQTGSEEELVQLLITAEIDAALMTLSHPAAADHSLITFSDASRGFPQDQYAPVVSSEIADEVPEVVVEISEALDEDSLLTLRRLIEGENGLSPEDAAVYWLVEEGLLAEPDDWG